MAQKYNHKGALQEHFAQNGSGITPCYKNHRKSGLEHAPTFTCTVSIGDEEAEGTARTKKDAEQEAAKNMRQKLGLIERPQLSSQTSTQSSGTIGSILSRGVLNPTLEANSVARLQELYQSPQYDLVKPIYDESGIIAMSDRAGNGLSHLFSTTCKIGELATFGKGRTKQESKEDSATKMLQRLEGLSEDYEGNYICN